MLSGDDCEQGAPSRKQDWFNRVWVVWRQRKLLSLVSVHMNADALTSSRLFQHASEGAKRLLGACVSGR